MNNKMVIKMVVSGIMGALAFILNRYVSIDIVVMKFTVYALPLMLVGMFYGPTSGLLSGFICGFLSQVFSAYGLTVTAPLWMLAPMAWGFLSGLIMNILKNEYNILKVVIVVVITSIVVVFLNSIAMYIDGIVFEYPVEFVIANLGTRIINALITSVFYTILLFILLNRLKKVVR